MFIQHEGHEENKLRVFVVIIFLRFLIGFGYQRRLNMRCKNSASFLTSALPNRGLV